MVRKANSEPDRAFSVDLKSSSAVRRASIGNGEVGAVAIEGTLGAFKRAAFLEGTVLEIVGTAGILRVDLAKEELENPNARSAFNSGGEGSR